MVVVDVLLGLVDPWLYVVVFLLAFAEGGALLGLFLPGESAMLLAGVLVSEGRATLGVIVTVAVAGSVLGDSVGYWTGRIFGRRLRATHLGRKIGSERWARAEMFIRDRGKAAVAVGRFASFLRTLVPPLAGSSHMPYQDFVIFNAPAAALWAMTFVLLGSLAGDSWDAIAQWSGLFGKVLIVVLLAGFIAVIAVRQFRARMTSSEKASLESPSSEEEESHAMSVGRK